LRAILGVEQEVYNPRERGSSSDIDQMFGVHRRIADKDQNIAAASLGYLPNKPRSCADGIDDTTQSVSALTASAGLQDGYELRDGSARCRDSGPGVSANLRATRIARTHRGCSRRERAIAGDQGTLGFELRAATSLARPPSDQPRRPHALNLTMSL
jgi:hypothetical protein